VDEATPGFPRPAGFWWFGCSSVDQGRKTGNNDPSQAGGEGKGVGGGGDEDDNDDDWAWSDGRGRSDGGSGGGGPRHGGGFRARAREAWEKVKGVFKSIWG